MQRGRIIQAGLDDIPAIASLHAELLPASLVPGLGRAFMTRAYYPVLFQGDFGGAFIAYWDDEAVGFAVYTYDGPGFMKELGRRKLTIAGAVLREMLVRPKVLWTVLKARSMEQTAADEPGMDIPAEFLSLGVREAYRSGDFVRENGFAFGKELFNAVIKAMAERGIDRLRLVTETASLNPTANVFYKMRGGSLIFSGKLRDKPSNIYVFEIPQPEDAPR